MKLSNFILDHSDLLSRFSIFIVYFWFGILKVFYLSPAEGLVHELYEKTLFFISFREFFILLGIVEVLIGVLFLIRRITKFAVIIMLLHMIATILPMFILRSTVWSGFMIPTLEGQYIIKNIVLIALSINIYKDYIVKDKNSDLILLLSLS